jgi:primosomal replication protein N
LSNYLQLSAQVTHEDSLRYTPAGIAILQVWLSHLSEQEEIGIKRKVDCTIQAVLVGQQATGYTGKLMGHSIEATGFITKRSLLNTRLVFHIQELKLI